MVDGLRRLPQMREDNRIEKFELDLGWKRRGTTPSCD
jgi:hypothetical protein